MSCLKTSATNIPSFPFSTMINQNIILHQAVSHFLDSDFEHSGKYCNTILDYVEHLLVENGWMKSMCNDGYSY